jgi:lysophospholipase L1-like esterase
MSIRTRIMGAVCGMVITVGAISPIASAATSDAVCPDGGPITSGLWQGFSMATGMQPGCQSNTATPGSVPPPTGSDHTYVALGDSVAAGLGLSPMQPGTNPACGVSSEAYPALVASALGRPYQTAACSGATMGDLFTEQHIDSTGQDIAPQINTAFANDKPSLITITAGANDVHWSDFIGKCYATTCGTTADQVTSAQLMVALRVKLAYALQDIRLRSAGSPPKVIVTGYYNPLSMACAQPQTGLTPDEITWLDSQGAALNQVLANTVSHYSFARFAPVDFSGHELCTSDPWVQGPQDAAPLHPTAEGQQAIARSVLATIH